MKGLPESIVPDITDFIAKNRVKKPASMLIAYKNGIMGSFLENYYSIGSILFGEKGPYIRNANINIVSQKRNDLKNN